MEPSETQRERLKDFAERTRANLAFIEQEVKRNPDGTEVFEVTQLLNSLLSLVVAADQWLVVEDGISLDTLQRSGFPQLRFSGDSPPCDLKTLMRFIRNAVGHVNVEVLSEMGEISQVTLWNHKHGRPSEPHTADLVVSVGELRQLAELLPKRCGLLEPATGVLKLRADRI